MSQDFVLLHTYIIEEKVHSLLLNMFGVSRGGGFCCCSASQIFIDISLAVGVHWINTTKTKIRGDIVSASLSPLLPLSLEHIK